MLKVLGLLAAVAAACAISLVLTVGPLDPYIATPAMIGREVGGWLTIFAVAAIGAAIAALVTRKRGHNYPGLTTGTVLAIAVAFMSWLGRQTI